VMKCDFCTKSEPNGKCFWSTVSARQFDCEKAINNMVKAFKGSKQFITTINRERG